MAKSDYPVTYEKEIALADKDVEQLGALLATDSVAPKKVWTQEQQLHLSKLVGAITHLSNAIDNLESIVTELVQKVRP
jgi:hypothetical protein